jgi:hypothetical protein
MSNYFLKNQLFYIDSNNRLSGSNTNFSYQIDISRNSEFDKVVLLDCSIPKTYYLVESGYNTFQLTEGTSTVTITLPFGNYSRTSLKNVLKTQLNANSPNSYVYTITNQNISNTQDTGQYTFTVSGNGSVQPIFTFTTSIYELLGFNANSTNQFISNNLVSTNVANLQPENTLFIRSDICQNYNDNILQNIISAQNANYSFIVFNNPNPKEYSKNFNSGSSNVFFFQITDENGTVLNTNGLNVVMTIMVYQLNRIDELLKAYVHYRILKEGDQEYIDQIENEDIQENKLSNF